MRDREGVCVSMCDVCVMCAMRDCNCERERVCMCIDCKCTLLTFTTKVCTYSVCGLMTNVQQQEWVHVNMQHTDAILVSSCL